MMEYKPYTTKEKVEAYLGVEIDNSLNVLVNAWIKAASQQIDKWANRDIFRALPEAGTVTYKYDGDGSNLTLIKDCHSITEVRVNGVIRTPLEYPTNKRYVSRLMFDGEVFGVGKQNVEVDATHCMAQELPEDIELAATMLVAGIHNSRKFAGKEGTTEKIGNYSISYSDESKGAEIESAKSIAHSYRRISL